MPFTGATVWSVDRDEVKEFKALDRYSLEGRDFRVYRNANAVDGLVPVYESDHLQSDVRGGVSMSMISATSTVSPSRRSPGTPIPTPLATSLANSTFRC